MESPAFSSFRYLIDCWDSICAEKAQISLVHQLLDNQEFVFFFKFDDSVFGAPEESRIMYAKMKHPDEEMVGKWKREANFVAINLDEIIQGHGTQRVFDAKDLKKIKVIDKEEAAEVLGKKKKGK
jgi:hypothetical protein